MNIHSKRRTIFFNGWFLFLLMIPIIQPDFFKTIPIIDKIYTIAKMIVCIIVFFKYFSTKHLPRLSMYILLMYVPMYIATIFNGQPIFYAVKKTIEIILLSMIIEIGIYYKGMRYIKIFYGLMSFFVYVNFLLLIVFPNGMLQELIDSQNYKAYFLSIKNGMIPWMILTATLGLILFQIYETKKIKKKLIILFVVITITMLWVKSSTGLIGWFLMLLYLAFINRRTIEKYINLRSIFYGFIFLFFMVVIVRVQEYFSTLFEVLFSKSGSFTGRSYLWEQSILFIKESPFIGYGLREESIIKVSYGRGFTSHNFILEILLSGGFLSLIIFILMLFIIANHVKKMRNSKVANILYISIFIFFVCTLTESGIYRFQWFALFPILYNIEYLIQIPPQDCNIKKYGVSDYNEQNKI